jgi:sterol desaturase/sphingolipid hydroxylase (fatty acid hydroxylase superfamily)
VNALAIALSVPFFFILIGVEQLWASRAKLRIYRATDAISSLACGVVQQATGVFAKGLIIGSYAAILAALPYPPPLGEAFFQVGSIPGWIVLMILVDHQYYWFHRASHRVNVFWATHVVHHQSEEYNLSTALRQSALQGFVSVIFYWPIALLGVPLSMFIGAITANTLYQFWIHTRLIGKLGPLEWVLNTPSHHRIHHGIDPAYIDKNYGGISIVWDRLYGTFAEETVEPSYGTVKPLKSFDALWANVDSWVTIARLMGAATTLREKLWAPFAPPEWQPAALGGPVTIPEVTRSARELYEVPTSRPLRVYVAAQFAVVGALLVALLMASREHDALELTPLVVWICVSTSAWSGLFEEKGWAAPLEIGRQLALPLVVWLQASVLAPLTGLDAALLAAIAGAVTLGSLVHGHLAFRAPRTRRAVFSEPVFEGRA